LICPKQLIYLASLSLTLLLYGCSERQESSRLEQVISSGQLRILTRFSPTTYFEGPDGYRGIEYDLAQLFAKQLGVRANFIVPENFNQILSLISEGEADIAAAGLTITDERKNWMRFAPAYQEVTEQIIYRSGTPRPKSINDLSKGIFEVLRGSSHIETLSAHRQKHFDLQWLTSSDSSSDELIELVNLQLIDYTAADSNQVSLYRQLYPKLHVAFDISESRKLAWALYKSEDTSLYDETVRFFKKIKKDGTLEWLIEKNFGHTKSFDYVGNCTFRRHFKQRLPKLQGFFEAAAEQNGLDWRLLAAMGYQESHWNPKAVSPTGVRGVMMLTQSTAKQLGVKNRLDPKESIFGGARYLAQRIKKIPKRIPEPDRTWMALAAYNVGLGHLEDARVLTERRKGNPDSWIEVKQHLPLLSKKKWYKQTKHGYARGREPVLYVKNIRNYYSLLLWLTKEEVIEMDTSNPSPLFKGVPAL
jgi:membrane-bound lytic murein transglycosylase F